MMNVVCCKSCGMTFFSDSKEQNQRCGRCQESEELIEALREIDTHIRSTSEPVPYIIETLKRVLPEYKE